MSSVNLDTIPDPTDMFEYAMDVGTNAVWADDPMTQIITNIVIVAVMMLSSSVGFIVGIPIAMAALFFLAVGIGRFILDVVR